MVVQPPLDSRMLGRAALAVAVYSVASIAFSGFVFAHTTNTGLATARVKGSEISYRLTLSLSELPGEPMKMVRLAADGNQQAAQAVSTILRERVRFAVDNAPCIPGRFRLRGSAAGDDRVVMDLSAACPTAPGKLQIVDELSVPFGEHYRSILSIVGPNEFRQERVFESGTTTALLDLGQSAPSGWLEFLHLGIEHILTGYDHLLFLLALLIGATSVWSVLGIVTAFTVAHSITVSVAGFGLLTLPSAIIEPAIAASIVWVALENIFFGNRTAHRWAITFLFGLVHGFGFAAALSEIQLSGWPLVRALVGFNVGVEVGQAVAVLIAAPLLLWLRRRYHIERMAAVGSAVVAAIGAFWLIERIFWA